MNLILILHGFTPKQNILGIEVLCQLEAEQKKTFGNKRGQEILFNGFWWS